MHVVGSRRSAASGQTDPDVDELYPSADIDRMLADADVVVIAAPLTAETRHLFDAARIGHMKPGAVLCNVARGGLVDEPALISALRSGHLAAAILDVVEEEPLPAGNPLWTAPNCYVSAHTSPDPGQSQQALFERTARNLVHALQGEELESQVL
jgi:(S)-sulfolactate dehydrogenase